MSPCPCIVNKEHAEELIRAVSDGQARELMLALIDGIERFFSEQPSLLEGHFDLFFFAEVVLTRLNTLWSAFAGTLEYWGPEPTARPVLEPSKDVSSYGLRNRQASNFVATRSDQPVRSVLQVLISAARVRQEPNATDLDDMPLPWSRPSHPLDMLFLAMALDYSLRPGQAARGLLGMSRLVESDQCG